MLSYPPQYTEELCTVKALNFLLCKVLIVFIDKFLYSRNNTHI
ncbi:hypothetical protein HMPREF9074_07354 [Capnocytophaga sp. oral taxon 329 str. F0087]|nr:hypothetical protein HMPREF9074_07354 [Capnocytophaga sp. oral taxon 329 str. F0087]